MSERSAREFGNTASYDRYVRAEWNLFSRDPARQAASRDAVAGLTVARVLDIGCGAGQQLRPFLRDTRTLGVGVDVAPELGHAGRELFAAEQPESRIAFLRAAAEQLPFRSDTFDLVISRLALPYTDNTRAIAEMARVLRSGGALLLKFHHVRYYLFELRQSLADRRVRAAAHACRVLLAGSLYHLTGRQPRGRFTGGETFQTMWLLRRELRRHGLAIRGTLADTVPAAPSVLVARADVPRT